MTEAAKFIEEALKKDPQDIQFEPIPDEHVSPLAQPVIQKPVDLPKVENAVQNEQQNQGTKTESKTAEPTKSEEEDAPEQVIDENPEEEKAESKTGESQPEFELPLSHATMAADTILGITNNVLEVGAGYFVTVRKHKDFYEFDEVIHVIEEQNVRNIKRVKLDEEDKALLRPLLIHILRKKSKVLTPEQQLVAVCLSIIVKKAKMVMEIRSENEQLVDRIRDIIRKERGLTPDPPPVGGRGEETKEQENRDEIEEQDEEIETIIVEECTEPLNETGLPDNVLEV